MDFKKFDPNIGVEGYCRELRSLLFPNSGPDTFNATSLNLGSRTYPKGSVFSRVRRLSEEDAKVFQEARIAVRSFFHPGDSMLRLVRDVSTRRASESSILQIIRMSQ